MSAGWISCRFRVGQLTRDVESLSICSSATPDFHRSRQPNVRRQKNASQATMASMIAPAASLPTVPHRRPTNAPFPAAIRSSSLRPFQVSPRYAPPNAPSAPPRTAITNEPITGTGVPIVRPKMLPNAAPMMERATDRRLAPCLTAPAGPHENSLTPPTSTTPTKTKIVVHVTPRPDATANSQANSAANATTIQLPGTVSNVVNHAATHSSTKSTADG